MRRKKWTRNAIHRHLLFLLVLSLCWLREWTRGHCFVSASTLDRRDALTPPQPESPASPPIHYHSYESMVWRLARVVVEHPELAELFTAQQRYRLPAVGNDCALPADSPTAHSMLSDLPRPQRQQVINTVEQMIRADRQPRDACRVWGVHITATDADSLSRRPIAQRPQLLVSGALHGDERIGSTMATELAALLTDVAGDPAAAAVPDAARTDATADGLRAWLRYLVRHRYLTIVPAANAPGLARNERTELGVDPNRDFPWNQLAPTDCMRTVAARAINELARDHLYQMLLTYHGGTTVIGYEWGDRVHCPEGTACVHNAPAPDVWAMHTIAAGMRAYAGNGNGYGGRAYQIGTMGDTVYPVAGGMEDWAYGASAVTEPAGVQTACAPTAHGGYPRERTVYARDGPHARMLAFLIETADDKQPPEATLGRRSAASPAHPLRWRADPCVLGGRQALRLSSACQRRMRWMDGHVHRNIRVALQAADVLEPYATWVRYPGDARTDAAPTDARVCWRIGGAYHVTDTQLLWWNRSVGVDAEATGVRSLQVDAVPRTLAEAERLATSTRWSQRPPGGRAFCVSLAEMTAEASTDTVWLRVRLRADAHWGLEPEAALGALPAHQRPLSHVARGRTDPQWYFVVDSPRARQHPAAVVRGRSAIYGEALRCAAKEGDRAAWHCIRAPVSSTGATKEPPPLPPPSSSLWHKLALGAAVFLLAPGTFPALLFTALILWRCLRGQGLHPVAVWQEVRDSWLPALTAPITRLFRRPTLDRSDTLPLAGARDTSAAETSSSERTRWLTSDSPK
ncbi:hypothetical protein CDCA_CDCA18G4568 [Cyanidium caldarium]|uniref:Peptidase M14 domain-containing protein n=1 Tax=Cyanidium caldarium TaxID=2771 RepID=A0AAV9J1R4_CYACA|nr:hypothetical protein CDCA_CDCA18G4568 [Cyanidium caldarium]